MIWEHWQNARLAAAEVGGTSEGRVVVSAGGPRGVGAGGGGGRVYIGEIVGRTPGQAPTAGRQLRNEPMP